MAKRRKPTKTIIQRQRFSGAAVLSIAVLCVAAGVTLVFHSLAAVQPAGIPGNWNLVFDDEFSGSSLDTSKWNPGWFGTGTTGPVNSDEEACYNSSNVSESGGVLNLNLVHQSSSCTGHNMPYTGALVYTNGKYSFTYGAVEARIFLPGSGQVSNWPAWWTDGQNWPTDGEMDVMEGLGGAACWHFHDPSGGPGGCAGGNYSGWHTFGADWEPGVVTYYYDGVQVGKISSGITSAPMYLILQNTTSSSSPTATPADMQVDYVRVWSYAGPSTPAPTPAPAHTPAPTAAPHTPAPAAGQSGGGSAATQPGTASGSGGSGGSSGSSGSATTTGQGGSAGTTSSGTSSGANGAPGTSASPSVAYTSPAKAKTVRLLGVQVSQNSVIGVLATGAFILLAVATFWYIQKTRL